MRAYLAIGAAIIIGLFLAWVWRVDSLRAGYKVTLTEVATEVGKALPVTGKDGNPVIAKDGKPKLPDIKFNQIAPKVRQLAAERDGANAERDAAKTIIVRQSESIRGLEEESARLMRFSAEQRAQIGKLLEQRKSWMAKARSAASPRARLEAEAEVKISEEAANVLYENGF